MEKSKALLLVSSLFLVVGVIYSSLAPQVALSPGEEVGFFAAYGFYVGLFVVWGLVAVFIIAKNRRQSARIKEKEMVKKGKKLDNKKIEAKVEKKVAKRVEAKVTKKVERDLKKKLDREIGKRLRGLKV
jgi:peroxiredoxin family protein